VKGTDESSTESVTFAFLAVELVDDDGHRLPPRRRRPRVIALADARAAA